MIDMSINPCFRCGNITGEKEKFCTNCGASLINRCTNDGGLLGEPCNKTQSKNALYCADCGSYTTFYQAGLLGTAAMPKHNQEPDLNDFNHFNNHFFTDL
jgi:hypothetical protein